MRVCIVTSTYHRPGETFVNHHIEHLFGGASAVVSVSRASGDNPYGKPLLSLADVSPGTADRILAPVHRVRNLLQHRYDRVPFGTTARALHDFLQDNGVEIILCEFGNRALSVAPLANAMGIPVFTYFRGFDASKLLHEPMFPAAFRRLMPRLDGVFAVSQFLLDNLARHGIAHGNAHVIPSGADTDRFRPGEKNPMHVMAVGRMVGKKTPLTMIDAFIRAARVHPKAQFTYFGGGPLLEACRDKVREAGLEDRIVLPGARPHEDVATALASAAIFAQHSVTEADGNTEGLPSSIQEAMACGCAVVSTRHAGIPEAVIEGQTGLLVDEHDVEGHADGIGRLLADPQMSVRMGQTGRAFAEEHLDKARLTARIEDIMRAARR